MKRSVRLTILAAALVGITVVSTGCSRPSRAKAPAAPSTAAANVLKGFFAARTKSGAYEASTTSSDGSTLSEKAVFWVSGRLFRIDYYRDGQLRISIRSADGVTAYFCHPASKLAEPSVATPDVYLRKFTKPSQAGESLGTDAKTGAEKIRYAIKETSNVAGSSNPWYVEDLVYAIKDGRLLSVVERGGVPHAGETTKLDTSASTFTELKTGEKIPASTFAIPYPISKKP